MFEHALPLHKEQTDHLAMSNVEIHNVILVYRREESS